MALGGSIDFWNVFFVGSFLATIVCLPFVTPFIWPEFRPALFMTTWMLPAAISAVVYSTAKRKETIAAFHAGKVFENSLFQSLHQVCREFSTHVHAAVMKDCIPYFLELLRLKFYRLEPNTVVNVLPQDWLGECNIKRS